MQHIKKRTNKQPIVGKCSIITNVKNLLYKLKQKNPDLKEAEIGGLLYLLKVDTTLTNSLLITKTGLPKETLKKFKVSIKNLLEETNDDSVLLSEEGKKTLEDTNVRPHKWSLLDADSSYLAARLDEVREKYGFDAKRDLDQFFATSGTSANKAYAIKAKGLVNNMSIALFGDDDLVSIALHLLSLDTKDQPKELIVFDIDPEIVDAINKYAEDNKLTYLKAHLYDARDELPKNQMHKFDVVMTDPPYTRVGVELFINRTLELLKDPKDESGPYLFLCYGNSFKEPDKLLKVQELITKYRLLLEDKINNFNSYTGAESIGNRSSLFVLKKNKHTLETTNVFPQEIYTFQNTHDEKFPYVDHFVFKLFKVPTSVVGSKKAVLKAAGQFCKWHKLNVLDQKVTKFKGGGLTITFVLAQSNLVVHTWPEKNAVHIDLITCMPVVKRDLLAKNLSELFKTDFVELTQIE